MNRSIVSGVYFGVMLASMQVYAAYHVSLNHLPDGGTAPVLKRSILADNPLAYQHADFMAVDQGSNGNNGVLFHVDAHQNLIETDYLNGQAGKSIPISVEGLPLTFYAVAVEKGDLSQGQMVAAATNDGMLLDLDRTTCTEQRFKLLAYPQGVSAQDVASLNFTATDNDKLAYLGMTTTSGKAFVYKLYPAFGACFDLDVSHHLNPVSLPSQQYGSYQLKGIFVGQDATIYAVTDNGLYAAKDQETSPLGMNLSTWSYNNRFMGGALLRMGQLGDKPNAAACLFSQGGNISCLLANDHWVRPAITDQLGTHSLYRYDVAQDSHSTNSLHIALNANGQTFAQTPYVNITYLGNTGKVIKTTHQDLSTSAPLSLNLMDIFRGFNTPMIEDPYWYKMLVGSVQLVFHDGSSSSPFATVTYQVKLDKSAVDQPNQLGAMHLENKDFGSRQGWQLSTQLGFGDSQNTQYITLTAPSDKTAFTDHAANIHRSINLDIHFDGSQSEQVPRLYNNGRQQIPLYVTACPLQPKDGAAVTEAQLSAIEQYVSVNNQNTMAPLGYHVDANGGQYTRIHNDYLPGIFNASRLTATGPTMLTDGDCANMLGAKTFVLYVSAKTATNSLPVYASVKYVDAHGKVQTATTQQSTENTIQVVTPNYHYQDADFAPTECKYTDDADALHAKYTCSAPISHSEELPSIQQVTYNKIYQLDDQTNHIVRLLEPDIEATANNLMTMSFYKPYYPTKHVGTSAFMEFKAVDQYGNDLNISMKPTLKQKSEDGDHKYYGNFEFIFPGNKQLENNPNVKQTYADNCVLIDESSALKKLAQEHTSCLVPSHGCKLHGYDGYLSITNDHKLISDLSLTRKYRVDYTTNIFGDTYSSVLSSETVAEGPYVSAMLADPKKDSGVFNPDPSQANTTGLICIDAYR